MSAPRAVRIGSARLLVDDDQPTFWERVAADRWEPGTIAAVERLVGPDTLFLDIGAWVGPLSLLAAARGARVVALDGDPAALDQMRRNLACNPDLSERVTVLACAVSARSGAVRLGARRKPGDSMSSTLLDAAETVWEADAVTPDEVGRFLPACDRLVAKLDIEGGEYAVLPALEPVLARRGAALLLSLHPALLVEAGVTDPHGRALAALTAYAGWRSAALGPGGPVETGIDRSSLARHDQWLLRAPGPTPG